MAAKSAAAMITVLGFLGCSDQNPVTPTVALEIYVVSGFQDQRVEIAIDGVRLYAGTVGAQPLSGPAVALYASRDLGAHRLDVNVGEQQATSDFVLATLTYVLIERDEQTKEIRVTVTARRPLWV